MRWPFQKKQVPLEQKSFSFLTSEDSGSVSRGLVYTLALPNDRENSSAVMACVGWARRNIGQASVKVFRDGEDGPEPVENHPLTELLGNPQGRMPENIRTLVTGSNLWAETVASTMLTGEAYWHKLRGDRGEVIGIDLLHPSTVRPVTAFGDTRIIQYYEVTSGATSKRVERSDIVFFAPFGLDPTKPTRGRDPLKSASRQIVTDNKIGQYSESVMGAPSPRLAVSPKDNITVTQADADRIQEALSKSMGGGNAGRAFVPTFAADVTPFSFSPDQMAVDTLRLLPEERITAVFGIPAIVVGLGAGLDRATYSNMKEAREAATEEFLVPIWTALAETVNDQLLPDFATGEKVRAAFDTSDVRSLQEDVDMTHKRIRDDFTANLISRAQALQEIGFEPASGDDQVYAWMLKPSPAPPADLPQGQAEAGKRRAASEGQ